MKCGFCANANTENAATAPMTAVITTLRNRIYLPFRRGRAHSSRHGPVIVMKCPVKPAKSSVYVKLVSAMLDSSVSLVQLPFGQVACASNCASVGAGAEVSEGTVSLPFFGESSPVLDGTFVTWDLTSTIWPPWLRHWTVAE